jgi:hypothetical protein
MPFYSFWEGFLFVVTGVMLGGTLALVLALLGT